MANAEDAPAIASLLKAFADYAPQYTPEAYSATTPTADEVAARISEGLLWVALQRTQIAGTVSVLPKPEGMYIRSMAVLPSARSCGIGYRLLNEIEDFAQTHGYKRLFLSTTPFLDRAIRLYEAFGFRRVNEGPHDLFGTPLFTMEKIISIVAAKAPADSLATKLSPESPEPSLTSAIPNWKEIQNAHKFLKDHFEPTHLLPLRVVESRKDQGFLKLESEMPTGSFKVRGALYALHRAMSQSRIKEVVVASTGNHGAAVAYAARILGVRAKIFLPRDANPVKQSRIRRLGAEIIASGQDISEACGAAEQYASESGAFMLNDATNPDVPAGTATIAIEIIEELPDVKVIWAPMGDTALIRGIASAAKHLRPEIRIVGVQAERAPAYYLSWQRGTVVKTETCDTIADGLATRIPLKENLTAIRQLVDDVRLVTEEQMLKAVAQLLLVENIRVEPAGAATTAAWIADRTDESSGQTALLLTGANISELVLQHALKSVRVRGS